MFTLCCFNNEFQSILNSLIVIIDFLYLYLVLYLNINVRCKIYRLPTIFFGIVSVTNSPRQQNIYQDWISRIVPEHKFAFLCAQGESKNNFTYISYPKEYEALFTNNSRHRQNQDRASKRIAGMHYFLQHTDCDYYWSITDDILVDYEEFDRMTCYLLRNFNTYKDNVCIGHNLDNFLQGATGFLMSRKAAQIVSSQGKQWIGSLSREDDVETSQFAKMLNIDFWDTYSPFVYGEEPSLFMNDSFWKGTFPKCSEVLQYRPEFELVNLIALHVRHVDKYQAMKNLKEAKKHINNLYFKYSYPYMELCNGPKYINDIYSNNNVLYRLQKRRRI